MGVTTTTRSSDASKKLTVLLFSIVLFGFCSVPSTLAFLHFATWNVRGISQKYSQHLAADDCNRYNLDVIALQETKVSKHSDTVIPGNHRLLLFDQKLSWHGGLGFIINRRFVSNVVSYGKL